MIEYNLSSVQPQFRQDAVRGTVVVVECLWQNAWINGEGDLSEVLASLNLDWAQGMGLSGLLVNMSGMMS